MVKVNIKNKDYLIPPLSALSFTDFHNIIVRGKAYDIPSYISIYTDIPLNELKRAKLVSNGSLVGLHRMIFDLNFHDEIRSKKEMVIFRGEYISVVAIGIDYFYQSYFFDMYLQKYGEKKIDFPQLALYSLAIGLLPEGCTDIAAVEELYVGLSAAKWVDVLPQAFFFVQHTKKKSLILTLQSKAYMWGLRKAQCQTRICRQSLGRRERKQLFRSFVSCLTQKWTRS